VRRVLPIGQQLRSECRLRQWHHIDVGFDDHVHVRAHVNVHLHVDIDEYVVQHHVNDDLPAEWHTVRVRHRRRQLLFRVVQFV
jgi:hypothetical protein